jgi:hypothetical protein
MQTRKFEAVGIDRKAAEALAVQVGCKMERLWSLNAGETLIQLKASLVCVSAD